jgi:Leucine-rich repeat (LRR) protein
MKKHFNISTFITLCVLFLLLFRQVGYAQNFNTIHLNQSDANITAAPLISKGTQIHKISSGLNELYQVAISGKSVNELALQKNLQLVSDRVVVTILPERGKKVDAISESSLLKYGVRIQAKAKNSLRVEVPVDQLKNIAEEISGIGIVSEPIRPKELAVTSEGLALMQADVWQSSAILGAGVKVAVIDGGFISLTDAQANGDIPSTYTAVDFTGGGLQAGTEHGTAVAEAIYDIAPQAELYLYRVSDITDLENAKDACIANGVNIINHSMGWFNLSYYDGTGSVCDVANDAIANGITWVNAAGNEALMHYRSVYTDNGSGSHNFGSGNLNYFGPGDGSAYNIPAGYTIDVFLNWDAYPSTTEDYDLRLYRWTGSTWTLAASSNNNQAGGSWPEPTERISFITTTSGAYAVLIRKYSTTMDHDLTLFNWIAPFNYQTHSSSLTDPASAAEVVTVGAIDRVNYAAGPQEDFSSLGPTTDGRIKPNVAAPDNCNSYAYGYWNGTSLASPHTAGICALIKSANPSFTNTDIKNYLYNQSTVDLGDAGMDNIYGWGKVELPALASPKETDSMALVALYNSTNGPGWTNNTNWLTGPVSSWYGITLDSNRVINISLNENNLSGTIPADIGNLSKLQGLYMHNNQLTGSIPPEIENLSNLLSLELGSNQLTGDIPHEIGNLSKIQRIYIYINQLTGSIPPEIFTLTNLQVLYLANNQLTGSIPAEIGNLVNLQSLSLGNNQLSGSIPPEIGNLTSLDYLYLTNNQLTGNIPPEIGNLVNIHNLYLSANKLSGSIPPEIGNLSSLEVFYLGNNQLTGSIPPEIGNLTHLQKLYLYGHHLTGSIPAEIGYLTNLQVLSFANNQLSGSLPSTIGNLSHLQNLVLSVNQLTGSIPPEIGNLLNLKEVNLFHNQFTGNIPEEINNLVNLTSLELSYNKFDRLPALNSLDSLNYLSVGSNKLTFEDIEPNIGFAASFTYAPQDSVGEKQSLAINLQHDFITFVAVGGEHNIYQWFKDDIFIPGAQNDTLILNNVILEDSGVYRCVITNTLATELTLYSQPILLKILNTTDVDQEISLQNGWNIFSLYAAPEDSAMLSIIQPLINEGSLVKVQNEAGKAIEYITPLHRWVDKIGKWQSTEGYKVRVNTNTTLNVTGTPIDLPIAIPLSSGWNITGYPVSSSQDALDAFSELITNGSLTKVQNESGQAIEYLSVLHRWVDKIDTLMPGEGYKVRVNTDDMLTINDAGVTGFAGNSIASSSINYKSTSGLAKHLNTCWTGNGLDHMNLYFMLKNTELQAGDEIGIFDGDLCVGAGLINNSDDEFISLISSADDPSTSEIDGFTEGNILQLKVWEAHTNKVQTLNNIQYLCDTKNIFEAMGAVFAEIQSPAVGVEDFIGQFTNLGNCYPNPFRHLTNIPFTIAEETDVEITICDMLGQTVDVMIHSTYAPGSYSLEWNGSNNEGFKVMPGIYFVKMIAADKVLVKTVELLGY